MTNINIHEMYSRAAELEMHESVMVADVVCVIVAILMSYICYNWLQILKLTEYYTCSIKQPCGFAAKFTLVQVQASTT